MSKTDDKPYSSWRDGPCACCQCGAYHTVHIHTFAAMGQMWHCPKHPDVRVCISPYARREEPADE